MQYKQIDGLRFFAVMAVILHHICPFPFLAHFEPGLFGVNLFFVISGFLITEILIREKIKQTTKGLLLKTFFTRRVLRIFPLYYLYIFICFLIVPGQTNEFLTWLLTYTINFWITIKNDLTFWYFTHLWSLGVEEQFYILWPFILVFAPIKRLKFLFILMLVLSILLRAANVFCLDNYVLFNYTMLPTTLDCFGFGALLAYMKTFEPEQLNKILSKKYIILVAVALFILNSSFGTTWSQQAFARALHAFVAFYLVGIAATITFGNAIKTLLENKLIMYFGKISYGMYIYHLLILGLFGTYFTSCWEYLGFVSPNTYPYTVAFFEFIFISICTIIVSILSFELFEKRFLGLRKYFVYS